MARGLKKITGWKAYTFKFQRRYGMETTLKVQDFAERTMNRSDDSYVMGIWVIKFITMSWLNSESIRAYTPKLVMKTGSFDIKCGFEIAKEYPNSRYGKLVVKNEDTDS
jgi:hypothetical protein